MQTMWNEISNLKVLETYQKKQKQKPEMKMP